MIHDLADFYHHLLVSDCRNLTIIDLCSSYCLSKQINSLRSCQTKTLISSNHYYANVKLDCPCFIRREKQCQVKLGIWRTRAARFFLFVFFERKDARFTHKYVVPIRDQCTETNALFYFSNVAFPQIKFPSVTNHTNLLMLNITLVCIDSVVLVTFSFFQKTL